MQSEASKGRVIALWVLGVTTLIGFGVFSIWDQLMHEAGGPGIARFEFVVDRITAARILGAWGDEGQDAARASLWFDFAFLLIYGTFLVLAIRTAAAALARRGIDHLAWMGSWIWIFAVAGAAFDVFEDIALLALLDGNTSRIVPALATCCAVLKFALLMGASLYLIVSSIALVRHRRRHTGEAPRQTSPQP